MNFVKFCVAVSFCLPLIASATIGLVSGSTDGGVGKPFSLQLSDTDAPSTVTMANLPAGLSYDAAALKITGTPTEGGSYPLAFTSVSGSGSGKVSRLTVIYVNITGSSSPPTLILPATLSDGVLGARFDFGAIGATPFNFHVTLDDEVDYLTRIAGTGVVEIIKKGGFVPMAGGLFGATVSVSNLAGSTAPVHVVLTLDGGDAVPVLRVPTALTGVAGQAFSAQLYASGATPITFSANGLPAGLHISGSTLVGTASTPGTYNVTFSATNALGAAVPATAVVLIGGASGKPVLYNPGPSNLVFDLAVGDAVDFTALAAGSPAPTVSFGALPVGLKAINGHLTGHAGASGTFTLPVSAINPVGSDQYALTFVVTGTAVTGTVKFSDSYSQALKKFNEGGESSVDIVANSAYSVSAQLNFPPNTPAVTSATVLKIGFGDYDFQMPFSAADKFVPGKSAVFTRKVDIGNTSPKLVVVSTVKVTFSSKGIKLNLIGKNSDSIDQTENLVVQSHLNDTAAIQDSDYCIVRIGSVAAVINVTYTGASTPKTVVVGAKDSSESFDLINASVKGASTK